MVRRRPRAPEVPSAGGRTRGAPRRPAASPGSARARGGRSTTPRRTSAGRRRPGGPRHSLTLPTTTSSPVRVCCHSRATWPQSSASRNLRSTPELAPPRVLRWPGSITEKISLSRTDLPPPFSRKSTPAGAGRRGGPVGSSSKNSRLGGRGLRHRFADSAQVEHGVGVARAGRPDGVEADPGQLVHGGGLSCRVRAGGGRVGGGRARAASGEWKGRPASAARSRSSAVARRQQAWRCRRSTGTTPRSSSSAIAALPAMSRTWSW